MFINVMGVDDEGTEFEFHLNMKRINFVIPEENAVHIDGQFMKLTKDAMAYLIAFLEQTWLEEE